MTVSRTYKSPLRDDQMEQTRIRIIETVADMLADGVDEITVATVAERAKVSVRTAYRYFPTKEDLIDAFNQWMGHKWGTLPLPSSIDDLPEIAARVYQAFASNEKLVRAARRSASSAEIRKRRKVAQARAVTRVIRGYAPHCDEQMIRKLTALFLDLLGSEAWLNATDHVGLTTPESIEAVRWGIEAFVAKIDSERPRKGRR